MAVRQLRISSTAQARECHSVIVFPSIDKFKHITIHKMNVYVQLSLELYPKRDFLQVSQIRFELKYYLLSTSQISTSIYFSSEDNYHVNNL